MAEKALIVFAGALYDVPLWTNRQQVATRLAERGWRVLYVEPRLFLLRQLGGMFLGRRGRLRWLLRYVMPWRVNANLSVVAQGNLLPGSRGHAWIGRLNHRLLNGWRVRRFARRLESPRPVLLVYDTEAAEFLDDFPQSRLVYDCVDEHRAQAGIDRHPARVDEEERALAARADAIAATTQPLVDRLAQRHRNVHLVPNAADVQAFLAPPSQEPADVAAIVHPRIGTVGALDAYKIDVELLEAVLRAHPDWQFVFVGPVDYGGSGDHGLLPPTRRPLRSIEVLREYGNAHFLGTKPHEEIPAYVHAFDVAIISYRMSDYNRASFPLKFWEFMASGKPVVVSGLPQLEQYRHLIAVAGTPEEFAAQITTALLGRAPPATVRQQEARRHSWEERVSAIERLLTG